MAKMEVLFTNRSVNEPSYLDFECHARHSHTQILATDVGTIILDVGRDGSLLGIELLATHIAFPFLP
jgi:hypothetical protein